MKIRIHKTGKWYHYWIPKWLNSISWKEGDNKIYRFLFWSWSIKKKTKNITFGPQDEHGFVDVYVNEKKINTRVLVFNEDAVNKIKEAQKEIREKNGEVFGVPHRKGFINADRL